jgi:hypothetical protein
MRRDCAFLLSVLAVLPGCGPGSADGDFDEEADSPAQTGDTIRGPSGFDPALEVTASDTPDAPGEAAPTRVPPDTTGTVLPGAVETVAEQVPAPAYEACKQSAAAKLAVAPDAIWAKAPDSVERTPEGDYALVAKVRPDTVDPGISYACVVKSEGGGWRVTILEAQQEPAAP